LGTRERLDEYYLILGLEFQNDTKTQIASGEMKHLYHGLVLTPPLNLLVEGLGVARFI
jgi:hypothetical protein